MRGGRERRHETEAEEGKNGNKGRMRGRERPGEDRHETNGRKEKREEAKEGQEGKKK